MQAYYVWVDRTFVGCFKAESHHGVLRVLGDPVGRVKIVPETDLETTEWVKVSSLLQA